MENQNTSVKWFPGFPVLMSEAFQTYKKGIKWILPLVIIDILLGFALLQIRSTSLSSSLIIFALTRQLSSIAGFYFLSLLAGVFSVILEIAVVLLISKIDEGVQKISMTEVLSKAIRLYIPYLIVKFFMSIAIAAGFALLIIPGIIVLIWTSLALYTVTLDNKRGFEALRLSKRYIEGYGVIVFLYSVGMGVLTAILLILPRFVLLKLFPGNFSLLNIIGIYEVVVGGLFVPLALGFNYFIYKHLKSLKPEEAQKSSRTNLLLVFIFTVLIAGVIFAFFSYTNRKSVLNKPSPRPTPRATFKPVVRQTPRPLTN